VLWAQHASTGRWAPLDAEPNPAGNLALRADGRAEVVGPPSLLDPDPTRFMPHHATCPDAATWRARSA
jgi:hypothetical protein